MNDNINDQKEKLVSISHEINLLRQQVNYLLRNEKALSLLDLDVLMNRTHAIYDLLCSVSLGNEADEQDLELDPEAIAGLFGIGEEPEPDAPEELMEEPEEEPVEEPEEETVEVPVEEPVEEPEEELVLESEEELVEEPEEEMFEEPVEEPVVEPKEEMFEEPEIPEVSEPNSSEVLEPAPEFDTVFKPVFEPEPIIDEPVEEEQVATIEMELEPEPVEEEPVAPIEMEFEPEPVEEEQVAPIELELEPEPVEEEQDAPIEMELEPEFDREPEAAEPSISENLEPEEMFVYDPQEDATAPETISEPEVFVEHVEEAPELEPEPAVSQSWSTEVFESEPESEPEPDRPVVIDGKTVHFVEEVPENEIPERDRVGGEELPKNNLFGLSLFDDEDFEMAPTETLGEKWGHEDNSLASKLQQNPGSDLKASIGINDKFLFVNELFGGSMEKYNKSIDNLNDLKTLNGAMIYLNELKIELQWNSSNEAYQRLSDLVSRKFE